MTAPTSTGRAQELDDASLRERLTAQILAERNLDEPWPGFESEPLMELQLDSVLITLTPGPRRASPATPSGGPDPRPTRPEVRQQCSGVHVRCALASRT